MKNEQIIALPCPGDILRMELEARGWSQVDLAEVLGRPVQAVNEILKGKKAITPSTARGLEDALGTKAEFWLNLETQFRLAQEQETDDLVSRRASLFSRAPLADMRRRHWVPTTKDTDVLEAEVLKLLRIKSLQDPPSLQFAARKSSAMSPVSTAQEAWCCRARQLAEHLSVNRFSKRKLAEGMRELRGLAMRAEDASAVSGVLASIGVRFVIVEHLPKTKIDGATFWLSKSRPVVAMSLRYARIDYFWFTLFHELSHVAHGDALSVDDDIMSSSSSAVHKTEQRANREASEILVPDQVLEKFIQKHGSAMSKSTIRKCADAASVHPGIVLGQLQHRGVVGWSTGRDLLVSVRECVTSAASTDGWGRLPSEHAGSN